MTQQQLLKESELSQGEIASVYRLETFLSADTCAPPHEIPAYIWVYGTGSERIRGREKEGETREREEEGEETKKDREGQRQGGREGEGEWTGGGREGGRGGAGREDQQSLEGETQEGRKTIKVRGENEESQPDR